MSLKGEYVRVTTGQVGMIEDAEPDDEGYVSVYFGTSDKREHRVRHLAILLVPVPIAEVPKNSRIDGEIRPFELEVPEGMVVDRPAE